jgi:hypothetical protein
LLRARGVGEAEVRQHLLELIEQAGGFLVGLGQDGAQRLGEEGEGLTRVGLGGLLIVHARAQL